MPRKPSKPTVKKDQFDRMIQALQGMRAKNVSSVEIGEAFLDSFGGPVGLVTHVKDLYDNMDLEVGHRYLLLKLMLDYVGKAAEAADPFDDLRKMPDDDLAGVIRSLNGRRKRTRKGGNTSENGHPQELGGDARQPEGGVGDPRPQ